MLIVMPCERTFALMLSLSSASTVGEVGSTRSDFFTRNGQLTIVFGGACPSNGFASPVIVTCAVPPPPSISPLDVGVNTKAGVVELPGAGGDDDAL